MNSRQPLESLSPEKLQLFAASLGHLPAEERRQAKLLYVRNAISEYRALEKMLDGFGRMQGCLSIIPIFWPVISMQKKMMNAQLDLSRERITNAVEVWKDDLQAAGLDVARFDLSQPADGGGGGSKDRDDARFTI